MKWSAWNCWRMGLQGKMERQADAYDINQVNCSNAQWSPGGTGGAHQCGGVDVSGGDGGPPFARISMNRLQVAQNLPLHKPESLKKLEKTAKIAAPVGLLVLTPSLTEAARTLALVVPVLYLLLLNRAAWSAW